MQNWVDEYNKKYTHNNIIEYLYLQLSYLYFIHNT